MDKIFKYLNSSVGRKVVMALTGLALVGFLVSHLAGNLLFFAGKDTFNKYSHALISNPLIYLAEFILLAIFLSHMVSAFLLLKNKKESRPVDYQVKISKGHTSRRSISSVTMILTGIVVLAFVPLHIKTFKFGPHYGTAGADVRDLHKLVAETFQNPAYVAWYVIAMIVIGFHLWHGFGSAFESLGVSHKKELKIFGQILAVLIAGGFLFIPVIIYFSGTK